jgi:hypothetical protein
MTGKFTTLLFILLSRIGLAQNPAPLDVSSLSIVAGKTPTETAVSIGRQLLGKPYVPHTLDVNPTEQLIVNVREFDCTTYLETVLALSLASHDTPDKAGSLPFERALSDPATFKQMQLAEASLNQQSFTFIPRKNIRLAESQLREGDIIMLMSARPGLDMKHVGLAVKQPNGRIHLMHASSEQGEVVITPYPLSDYVLWHKHLSGVRVARLRGSGVLTAVDLP